MKAMALAALAATALLAAGCQSEPIRTIKADFKRAFSRSNGDASLAAGIQQYEAGKYAEASKQLQAAIDQGLSASDEVKAHKYLAFIHCVSNRLASCREQFRMALRIDPSMELTPAEAGHPSWGPVFRAVKAGR